MISMTCSCGGDFWVRDRLAGQSTQCPSCKKTLGIPPMTVVEERMTLVRCACGEPYWSSNWRPGRRSKCPICGRAVGSAGPTTSATASVTSGSISGPAPIAPPLKPSQSGFASPKTPAPGLAGRWDRLIGDRSRRPLLIAAAVVPLALLAVAVAFWPGEDPTPVPDNAGNLAGPSGNPDGSTPPVVPPNVENSTLNGNAADEASSPSPLGPEPTRSARLRLLVPAYFYPGGPSLEHWNRLIDVAHRVPIVAVVNPSSGPGTEANPDYAAVIRRAEEAGVVVAGYVNTQYGQRPLPEIEEDVDRWSRFYPDLGGIFFDAQASGAEEADAYAGLHAMVADKIDQALVITNPGTVCVEDYFAKSATNIAVLFENLEGFRGFQLPSWAGRYDAGNFAALPYDVETAEEMRECLRQAVLKGVGCIYVSDAIQPNPWDRLPAYWDEEVEAIQRINQRLDP